MVEDNQQLIEAQDVFDGLIADSTRNELDIASHYPYSPERWRVFLNGSREFIQYGSSSAYNHAGDVHELTPTDCRHTMRSTMAQKTTTHPS